MSLLSSFPHGLATVGWRRLSLTALAFMLAPVTLGAVAFGVGTILGPEVMGEAYVRTMAMATIALISPLVGLPTWAMMAIGAGWLLKIKRFGALPAALLGTLLFAALARTDIGLIALPFGAVSGLLFRMALTLQRPEAF